MANQSSNNTQVTRGERVPRWTKVDVEGQSVVKHHVTQNGHGDEATFHELEWTFDFTDVTQEELLELASRPLVITARPKFKKAPPAEIPSWNGRTFKVRDFLDRERKARPPKEVAAEALGRLSEAELAEILEKYGSKE